MRAVPGSVAAAAMGLVRRRWWSGIAGAVFLIVGLVLLDAWRLSGLSVPGQSVFLTDRHGAFLGQISFQDRGHYGYWPLQAVPERISMAALALEDRRFWTHPGVDILAAGRAALQNLSSGRRISGASTIAMQVVRMQHPMPRSLFNKGREALAAVFLTARHGRREVLSHYLRLVPYGNGSHGIRHAARFYFDKPAGDMSWAEIAYLAAIPQAPSRMNPYRDLGRLQVGERAARILSALEARGVIDPADLDLARRQLSALRPISRERRPKEAMHALFALARQLRANPPRSPVVRASLDLDLQEKAHAAVVRQMAHWRAFGADHAAVLVADRHTMAVRVLVGSADYFDPKGGAIDYTDTPRSPGSALKPFIYALALETGDLKTTQVLMDAPKRARWADNADRRFLGPLLPRQALANSRNVPAVNLVRSVGLPSLLDFLRGLKLHDGRHGANHYGAGIAIGTMPVRLSDTVAAYGALANDGLFRPLRFFEDGPRVDAQRVMGTTTARLITDFLSDPMARVPTFDRLGPLEYPFPAAVKTGTSQNYRDAWTFAYTADFVVGVWMGRTDGKPMGRINGGGGAARLLRAVLLDLVDDNKRQARFAPPVGLKRVAVCSTTGLPPGERCPNIIQEWLEPEDAQALSGGAKMITSKGDPDLMRHRLPLRLRIAGPPTGAVVYMNPETQRDLNVVRLRADIDPVPPNKMVVWYVNGRPERLLRADRSFDWPLQTGRHTFQIRLPYRPERSPVYTLTVR